MAKKSAATWASGSSGAVVGATVVAAVVLGIAGGTVLVVLAVVLVARLTAVVLGGADVGATGEAAAPVHALRPATNSAVLSTAGARDNRVLDTKVEIPTGRRRAGGHPR